MKILFGRWQNDYEKALMEAKKEKKMIGSFTREELEAGL
jgi:hypothetical protein